MPIYDTPAGLTALDTRALPSPEPDEAAGGNGRIFPTAREAAQHGTLDDVAEAIVREAVLGSEDVRLHARIGFALVPPARALPVGSVALR